MSGQLRVLQLLPTLNQGGAELYVYRLAKRQRGGPVESCVCSMLKSGPVEELLREADIATDVLAIPRPSVKQPAKALSAWRRLFRAVRDVAVQQRVDVIQTHLSDSDWIGLMVGRSLGLPVVLTFHSSKLIPPNRRARDLRARARRMLQTRFYRRADGLIAVGSDVQEQLLAFPGVRPERVHLVPSAIEVPEPRSEADRAALRQRHAGLLEGRDGPILATVGRLVPSKGHDRLIRAMPRIRERHPDAMLWIIGGGPEQENLEAVVAESGASDSVRLLGGRHDVAEILPLADLYVTGTKREGLGLAVAEGMAAELAVVAYRVSGVVDIVADGENGVLVDDDDLEGFCRAVGDLLDDPARRTALAARGRETSLRFDIERSREKTDAILQRVCAARAAQPA